MLSTRADGSACRFGVLGPVQVWRQGVELDLGARQQRLILALLLANAGQPVGLHEIIEVLWDQRPPQSAVNVVHRYVGALRRLFEPGLPARSAGRWLLGDAAGYRMQVDENNLDLLKLRVLAEQARSDERAGRLPEAMSVYENALALWRGPCGGAVELAANNHVTFNTVDHECADLLREASSLALRLERSRAVLPVLRRVAEYRPWDEALQARLLLTLSADGQQAEAIALFQNVRRRLSDELGVDPGDELRSAYQLVLQQRAGGSGVLLPSTIEPAQGGVRIAPAPALARVLPAQLPADLPCFTGRDEAQRRTLGLVNGHVMAQSSMPVLAIDGIPGIGKTTLAIHLAHQLADVYPDGQLYVDLHGFDPEQSILQPAVALQGFLNALGVPDADIPSSHHARSGLYRSVLAGRRILVVLDNAHSVEQVRPLLPGAAGCLVLVTSRKRLTGLATAHGGHLMTLDVLSVDEARGFLLSRIGASRSSADADALEEIIERCGRLPLALAVVAARALIHPDHRLSDIARELRRAQGSLDGFSCDDTGIDIRAIFSWSYRMLGARAGRLFRLLSLHPGPDLPMPAMASLAGVPLSEARTLAGELVRTGLVTEHAPGRFSAHDLIRTYAQELVQLHDDSTAREQAIRRVMHHYQQSAYEAGLLMTPVIKLDPPKVIADVVTAELNDADEAISWFNAERHVLKAVIQRQIDDGHPGDAWRMAQSLPQFFQLEGWWHDWAAMARACLRAAAAAGDTVGEAYMTRNLASAEHNLGDQESAARLLRQALDLFYRLGLRTEHALVYLNLGQVSIAQEDPLDGIAYFERALRLFEKRGDLRGQVYTLRPLAVAYSLVGRHDEGIEQVNRALPIAEALNDLYAQGACHETMGRIHRAMGDQPAALTAFKQAMEIYRTAGTRRITSVDCLQLLGDTALDLGDRASARAAWQEALGLLRHLRVPQVTEIRDRLAHLEPPASAGVREQR